MAVQLAVHAMNRNKEAGFDQREHEFQLFFAGMSAHVDGRLCAVGVIDLRAAAIEVVHHPGDRAFISRNHAGGEHYGVARLDLHIPMVVERQSGKRGQRLALAAARHHAQTLARIIPDVLRTNHCAGRQFEESQLFGGCGVFRHAPAEKAHHAAKVPGLVQDELQPRDRRCKAR